MTDIRDQVQQRYARTARSFLANDAACCGTASQQQTQPAGKNTSAPCCAPAAPSSCCCSPGSTITSPDSAGSACCCPGSETAAGNQYYSPDQAEGAPATAVEASLGCGNPVALAGLFPGQVVVDLGSGGGLDVILAARKVGPTGFVYGVDMTPEMLALARANQRRAGLENVAFLEGRIEQLPLGDDIADVVISNCVINLTPDKDAVLRECLRVLHPGGILAVSDTVFTSRPPAEVTSDPDLWCQCVAGALMVDDYHGKLASAGFTDIVIQVSGQVMWGPAQLASASVRARKPRAAVKSTIRAATDADMPAIRELLSGSGLPLAGIDYTELMVCDAGSGPAAVAGLEWHSGEVLLRSVAVARQFRSHGLGRGILAAAVSRARAGGAQRMFLLTTTAIPYFAGLGFEIVGRQALPPALNASAELQGACPATAAAMRLVLT